MNKWLAAIAFSVIILVGIIGTGFLGDPWNNIDLWVQQLGWGEENLMSPISDASVDFTISSIPNDNETPSEPFDDYFDNVIDECGVTSTEFIPASTQIICKLTNEQGNAVAEGKEVLIEDLQPGEKEFIPIEEVAFEGANDVQNIHDTKLIVQNFGKCECKEIKTKPIDPKDFEDVRNKQQSSKSPIPPKSFGDKNPHILVKEKRGDIIVEVTSVWQKTTFCAIDQVASKCTGFVELSTFGTNFKVDGKAKDPDKSESGRAKISPKTGKIQFFPQNTRDVVKCHANCELDDDLNPIGKDKFFAFLTKLTFKDVKGKVEGDLLFILESNCNGDKDEKIMAVRIQDNEIDFDNSNLDNDSESGKDDADDYDPNVT